MKVFFLAILAIIFFLTVPGRGISQDKTMLLSVPQNDELSGLLGYLLPRFSLKTGIRVQLVAEGSTADLRLAPLGSAANDVPVIGPSDGTEWGQIGIRVEPASEKQVFALRFVEWLVSEVGHNTIASYRVDGQQMFAPLEGAAKAVVHVQLPGDAVEGERLAELHCQRCHVVNDKNRFAGIGSTPSFRAMRNYPEWQDRFMAFFTENPHPSFTQIEGVTIPFDPNRQPAIAPLMLTYEDVEAVTAYVATLEPLDLGADVQSR